MKHTATLDEAIDTIAQLPSEQQEMLIKILRNRQIDGRREDIAQHARHMIAAYRGGQLRAQSAKDVIAELHQDLAKDQSPPLSSRRHFVAPTESSSEITEHCRTESTLPLSSWHKTLRRRNSAHINSAEIPRAVSNLQN
jgi:hypothetical protein